MDTLIVALRVILSLGVVLVLLWYLQKRLSKAARGNQVVNLVTVVGRQVVGAKSSVVVVDVDGQRLVLGVTEQSVSLLHGGATPIATEGGTGQAEFARLLAAATDGEPGTQPALATAGPASPAPGPDAARFVGSILSPSTWQQAAAALRQRR
ncbi:flagellar biosynthetic protein FliO [Cryobacterium melibiosiphilum]|uniref:Flagellar biosynthetic protein FliO n=1 Tax=Cryobacterium melibiosiphilum TaxID=995039 RepID=A0A3A5MRW0_9MICO|nr:flagellar biosynthetic protein FliO [Cryobacterium melibiosiphilum]RJT88726.1 flagellar biosynthetic protein FliO [Cryobacterium melibiosiphilum]